ncbi:MAG: flagellar biosynthesis protein FlhB [Planctomycetes bacterium]|nr:flagellar biosynthesis protein FlhB [Planctomycetota bacterium]
MAADSADKTEPATPRRREDARKEGQIARSQDLPAAVLLFATFATLYWIGPRLWRSFLLIVQTALSDESPASLDELWLYSGAVAWEIVGIMAPFLIILFVAVLASVYVQVGWLLTFKPLMPSLSKVNPLAGVKRLFSIRMIMRAVSNFGKLLVVAAIAWLTLRGSASAIMYAFTLDHYDVFRVGSSLMFKLGMRLSVALFILALLDVAWQRYRHSRDLRMTKEEVKDELRSMEGDPKLKQRRRQVQLQLAMQRLRNDVPTADVVVTNPTHYAVAIRYDNESMLAPKVVAKGADYLALRIRQIAAEFGIPLVERAPLAQALYANVEVGQSIPEKFYQAVAEILAYVYELSPRRPGRAPPAAVSA